MLINDLKKTISEYKEEQLKKIIVDLYKLLPPKIIIEKKIDSLIISSGNPAEEGLKKDSEHINIAILSKQVNKFNEFAYKRLFYIPNKYVSRKEQAKWFIQVKDFYKNISKTADTGENLIQCHRLLEDLYRVLCYSCNFITFRDKNSFQKVGIKQVEFYRVLLNLKYSVTSIRQFFEEGLILIFTNPLSEEAEDKDIIEVLLEFVKTPDSRQLAFEVCIEVLRKCRQKEIKVNDYRNHTVFHQQERINLIVITAFKLLNLLQETDEAIDFFQHNYLINDDELALFVLIKLLLNQGRSEYVIRVYEEALKRGINPREDLLNIYSKLKTTEE